MVIEDCCYILIYSCVSMSTVGAVYVDETLLGSTNGTKRKSYEPTYYIPPEYFTLKGKGGSLGTWLYTCKKCVNKDISGSYTTRSNLRNHMKSLHGPFLKDFEDKCSKNDKRKRKDILTEDSIEVLEMDVDEKSPDKFVTEELPQLPTRASANHKPTQKEIDGHIVQYLVESFLPFSHVESTGFKTFLNRIALGKVIKGGDVYEQRMGRLFEQHKDNLKRLLSKADKVCLTLDYWTGHKTGYIGVTANWYDSQLKRHHACIALRRITGSCTYDVLSKLMESILAEYNIANKVTHCVIDSGSNFVRAFAEFNPDKGRSVDEEDINCGNLLPQSLEEMLSTGFDGTVYKLPQHFVCAANRIKLVAASVSDSVQEDDVCKELYISIMNKLTALWHKQSSCAAAADKVSESLGELLVTPDVSNWNSTFNAMAKVREMLDLKYSELLALFLHFDISLITEDEKVFLKEYVDIMTPLVMSFDVIQQKKATAGYLLPTLANIQEEWQVRGLMDLKYQYCTGLLGQLGVMLRQQFADELDSTYFKVAAALHPKFRLHWLREADKGSIKVLVHHALSKFDQSQTNIEPEILLHPDSGVSTKSFFWRFEARARAVQSQQTPSCGLYQTWLDWCYTSNPLPAVLRDAFIEYNTTLPSSTGVEKLTSLGTRVMTPAGTLLSGATFESMVMLTCNQCL